MIHSDEDKVVLRGRKLIDGVAARSQSDALDLARRTVGEAVKDIRVRLDLFDSARRNGSWGGAMAEWDLKDAEKLLQRLQSSLTSLLSRLDIPDRIREYAALLEEKPTRPY